MRRDRIYILGVRKVAKVSTIAAARRLAAKPGFPPREGKGPYGTILWNRDAVREYLKGRRKRK